MRCTAIAGAIVMLILATFCIIVEVVTNHAAFAVVAFLGFVIWLTILLDLVSSHE